VIGIFLPGELISHLQKDLQVCGAPVPWHRDQKPFEYNAGHAMLQAQYGVSVCDGGPGCIP
jgi:hypothetical protein